MTEKPQTKNKQEYQVFKVSNDKTVGPVILYKPLNLVCLQSNREPAHHLLRLMLLKHKTVLIQFPNTVTNTQTLT